MNPICNHTSREQRILLNITLFLQHRQSLMTAVLRAIKKVIYGSHDSKILNKLVVDGIRSF